MTRNYKMPQVIEIDQDKMLESATLASSLLKTLSHRDRLMILCQLVESEKSVSELEEILEISQSPLSQHLARMRHEGLVTTRREGKTIHYSLQCKNTEKVIGVLYSIYCE